MAPPPAAVRRARSPSASLSSTPRSSRATSRGRSEAAARAPDYYQRSPHVKESSVTLVFGQRDSSIPPLPPVGRKPRTSTSPRPNGTPAKGARRRAKPADEVIMERLRRQYPGMDVPHDMLVSALRSEIRRLGGLLNQVLTLEKAADSRATASECIARDQEDQLQRAQAALAEKEAALEATAQELAAKDQTALERQNLALQEQVRTQEAALQAQLQDKVDAMQKQLDLVRQLDAMQAQLNELQASRAGAAALAPAPAPALPQQRSLEECPGDELDARLQQLMGEAEELRRVKQQREAAQNQMLEPEPEREHEPELELGQEPEHEPEQEPESEQEQEPEHEPEQERESEPEPEPEPEREPEPGPEPQVQAQGQEPRPEHEQKQQPQPQPSPNLE
jgi:hypothetical protein